MGNKKNSKRLLKKIKIRLVNPGIPDSYVCEILESSLESEDECAAEDTLNQENSIKLIKDSKLKNYFEVLMPNEYKKNFKINSIDEDKKFFQEEILHRDDSKKKIEERKVDNDHKQWRQNEFSDDETRFQIKKKCKFINGSPKLENVNQNKMILNEIEIQEETEKIFDSPKPTKVEFILKKHQSTNILNYFSSTGSNKNKQIINSDQFKKLSNLSELREKQSDFLSIGEENSSCTVNKTNIKLAPLFIKKEKKIIDPEVQKARNDFLHKRLPPLKNVKNNKTMEFSDDFVPALHVQQKDDSIFWSKRDILLPCNVKPYRKIDLKKFYSKVFQLNIIKNKPINNTKSEHDNEHLSDIVKLNAETLSQLKSKYKNLNLDILINNLKQKKDKFMQLSCSLKVSKSTNRKCNTDKIDSDDSGVEELNTLWIDKYRPSSTEILGNDDTVKKLKTWLQSWKAFDEELKILNSSNKKVKKEKEDRDDDSESDYFVDSDEEKFGLKAPYNICILSGPNGCGKTALVFALAEELEFNVVEMNASCKRSGKNVLTYFQEATQSHKVHRVALPTIVPNHKNPKNKRRRKEKRKEPQIFEKIEEGNDSKISLLLIEDADIVFDEKDDGFYNAVASLVQTSKRPFIFVSNDSSYTLLDNFKMEKSLLLKMKHPPFHKSCAVLDVVSVLEGKRTSKKMIEFILQQNCFDLRKSLLDLQIWNGCSEEALLRSRPFNLGEFWWGSFNFSNCRYLKPFIGGLGKRKRQNNSFDCSNEDDGEMVEIKKFKQSSTNTFTSHNNDEVVKSKSNMKFYFDILDVMSTVDVIGSLNVEEPIPDRFYKVKDSLSLEERTEDVYSTRDELKKDLIEELIASSNRIFFEETKSLENDERKIKMEFPCWEEIRWRKVQEKARQELSALLPIINATDGRSSHLDYLPVVRNICRIEKNRSLIYTKRKNRFNHYFNNSSTLLTEKNLEINQQVFNCNGIRKL